EVVSLARTLPVRRCHQQLTGPCALHAPPVLRRVETGVLGGTPRMDRRVSTSPAPDINRHHDALRTERFGCLLHERRLFNSPGVDRNLLDSDAEQAIEIVHRLNTASVAHGHKAFT